MVKTKPSWQNFMDEEDLREIEERITKSSGSREKREREKRQPAMKKIEQRRKMIEAKVLNVVRKKGVTLAELKQTVTDIRKEEEGEWYYRRQPPP